MNSITAKCGLCCIWGLVNSAGSITITRQKHSYGSYAAVHLQPLEQQLHSGRST